MKHASSCTSSSSDAKKNMVRFIQINVGKRVQASDELSLKCKRGDYDIAMIQEPSVFNSKVRKIEGGVVFHTTAKADRIRACIWISDELVKKSNCIILNQFSDKDQAVVKLNLRLSDGCIREVILCSAYFPGVDERGKTINNPIGESLAKLTEHCRDKRTEVIISCDANAHHQIWGCDKNSPRGNTVLEYLIRNNLKLLNEGNTPTFSNTITGTVIDLTIASQGMGRKLVNWKVLREDSYSDHKYIKYELGTQMEEPTMFRNKKKTNWEKYRQLITEGLDIEPVNINSIATLETEAEKLNSLIYSAYLESCKAKKFKKRYNLVWQNQNLMKLRKDIRKEFNNVIRTKKQGDKEKHKRYTEQYNQNRNNYRQECKKARKESWKNKVHEVDNAKDCSRLQKILENGPAIKLVL